MMNQKLSTEYHHKLRAKRYLLFFDDSYKELWTETTIYVEIAKTGPQINAD